MLVCKSEGLILQIRLTPNASRDVVEGRGETAAGKTHLSVRVRAIPEKGKANKALIALLAKFLSLPKRDLEIIRGSTSRIKSVSITTGDDNRKRIVSVMESIENECSSD